MPRSTNHTERLLRMWISARAVADGTRVRPPSIRRSDATAASQNGRTCASHAA
jgi:hypothetical protein